MLIVSAYPKEGPQGFPVYRGADLIFLRSAGRLEQQASKNAPAETGAL